MKQTTISVQDISGTWEQLGTGRMRGIHPVDDELTSDTWGAKDATFTLTRELYVPWPDIQAFAPIEVTVGGVIVWRGRVIEAPTNSASRSISVRCEGKQNHLDDDQFEHTYVHTDLSQWADVRSFITANLPDFPQSGTVAADYGITVGFPADVALPNLAVAAVALDLGPDQLAERIIVTYAWRNLTTNGNQTWNVWSSNDGVGVSGLTSVGGGPNPGTGSSSGVSAFTLSTPARYLHIGVQSVAGGAFTPSGELTLRLDSVQVFTSAAYESGSGTNPNYSGSSVLRGDQIVADALATATVKLSSDRSLIDSTGTSFYIPEFAPSGPRTPRQAIEAANAFYDWRTKVDESDRFVFEDRTGEAPAVRVGRWGSSSFEDASSASGDEVYNKVIVSGQDAAGQPIRAVVTTGDLPDALYDDVTSTRLSNPGFETNTTGWTPSSATITRDTGTFDTGVASGRWDKTGASDAMDTGARFLLASPSGTFKRGRSYTITARIKAHYTGLLGMYKAAIHAYFGDVSAVWQPSTNAAFETYTITWRPKADSTSVFSMIGGYAWYHIDSVTVAEAHGNIVDVRDFTRTHTLDASFMLTTASANRLGQIYLAAHRTSPFKGQGQITGHSAARDYTTGQPIAPERLLLMTDRLMHFDDRIDPDTGAVGRDGRIVNVRYSPATDTATFDIDNSRKDFDALLERLGVSIGQIR